MAASLTTRQRTQAQAFQIAFEKAVPFATKKILRLQTKGERAEPRHEKLQLLCLYVEDHIGRYATFGLFDCIELSDLVAQAWPDHQLYWQATLLAHAHAKTQVVLPIRAHPATRGIASAIASLQSQSRRPSSAHDLQERWSHKTHDACKQVVKIYGAGIAGLTLAWELHRRGIYTTLFTQDPYLQDLGANQPYLVAHTRGSEQLAWPGPLLALAETALWRSPYAHLFERLPRYHLGDTPHRDAKIGRIDVRSVRQAFLDLSKDGKTLRIAPFETQPMHQLAESTIEVICLGAHTPRWLAKNRPKWERPTFRSSKLQMAQSTEAMWLSPSERPAHIQSGPVLMQPICTANNVLLSASSLRGNKAWEDLQARASNFEGASVLEAIHHYRGERCISLDRAPLIGPLRWRKNTQSELVQKAYVMYGLGSRGLLWAHLAAQWISDNIQSLLPAAPAKAIQSLDPYRFEKPKKKYGQG